MSATRRTCPSFRRGSTDPAQVERATETDDSLAAFFGILAIVLLGGAITWWQITAIRAKRAEYEARK
jgi:hypothetical protein